ncbi:MAG: hypothetical protein ACF8QF_13540 [Phycisphaerales bacterium]
MPALTLLIGLVLALLGAYGYFSADEADRSVTALIPAFFGLPIAVLGALALAKDGLRKHAMHGAAALALLGLIGAAMQGLPKLGALMSDPESLERPTAVLMQNLMALACSVLVVAAVFSFVSARKKAKA